MRWTILLPLALLIVACEQQSCPPVTCPVCACPSPTQPDTSLHISFIDVGQGDSALIRYGETEMLIDCGKNAEGFRVAEFLRKKDIKTIEYLLMTHPDSDHIGGCDEILDNFDVKAVITNGDKKATKDYNDVMALIDTEQIIVADVNDSWNIGPAKFTVIQSNNGFADANLNSVVGYLDYKEVSFLFTGDCDKQCEDMLVDSGRLKPTSVLKVAHHGSKYGTGIAFLEAATPETAVISVGMDNAYGHPAPQALDRLSQEGIPLYRTDYDGTISFHSNGISYGLGD